MARGRGFDMHGDIDELGHGLQEGIVDVVADVVTGADGYGAVDLDV